MKKMMTVMLFLAVTAGVTFYGQSAVADDNIGGAKQKQQGGPSMGGATGGTRMELSYDQRDQFLKTEKTKVDSFKKRIDMLDENARKAPASVNAALKPKISQLYGMSNDINDQLTRVKTSPRDQWSSTKSDIQEKVNDLELQLMEAEKSIS